jgi:hypothetical protein
LPGTSGKKIGTCAWTSIVSHTCSVFEVAGHGSDPGAGIVTVVVPSVAASDELLASAAILL